MKTVVAIFLILILYAHIALANPPLPPLPAYVSEAMMNGEARTYLMKVSEIPVSVISALEKVYPEEKLKMADKGGPWNKTCVVSDPCLPFRQLIWATEVNNHFIIHYATGGFAPSTHFLIISAEDEHGERALEWSAGAFKVARDFATFLKMVADGKMFSEPA